jgi:2-dehydro-3-deoxyphosphogluconate aldolase / (4S)-4-hydroxy-2-oxoglutarate aldolase
MIALETAVATAPVIAVIRHDDPAVAEAMARAAVAGGIRIVEITFTVPGAPEVIARLARELPDVVVGAGTVLTTSQMDAAASAGAGFVVSPVTDAAVAEAALGHGIPFIPGAFTPTEVAIAAQLGAYAVKIFPASTLGAGFVSSLAEVLPAVKLVPTGGIAPEQVGGWLAAGATAVGIAGALRGAWQRGGAEEVSTAAAAAVDAATNTRSAA